MAKNSPVKKDQAIILVHKELGYVRAWAVDAADFRPGGSSLFRASVNSPVLPGISEAVFNTNIWAVYDEYDPEVLKKIADTFVQPEIER